MKKTLKLTTTLTSSDIVSALGRGYREAQLSIGNGGFRRQTTKTKSKNEYCRKQKHKNQYI